MCSCTGVMVIMLNSGSSGPGLSPGRGHNALCFWPRHLALTVPLSTEVSKGRDTRCDKSLRHVATTGCRNKSPRVTCENHCCYDRICRCDLSLNSCDRSQRQNKGKRLVAATVQTRRLVVATCRYDLSHRVSRP